MTGRENTAGQHWEVVAGGAGPSYLGGLTDGTECDHARARDVPSRFDRLMPPTDLVGPAEIASRLGVQPQTVSTWKLRGMLPEPLAVVSKVPVWEWSTILSWARESGRASEDLGDVKPMRDAEVDAMRDHANHPDPELEPEECPTCRLIATVILRRR